MLGLIMFVLLKLGMKTIFFTKMASVQEIIHFLNMNQNLKIMQKHYTMQDYPTKKSKVPRSVAIMHPLYQASPNYITRFAPLLNSISYHRYSLTHCNGRINTLAQLLADTSTNNPVTFLEPFVKDAKDVGLDFYVGEGNSVSCGGEDEISNVYGASLWAVDILLNLAAINVKGFNFHGGSSGYYTAIAYTSEDDPIPDVRPLYYGLWVFSEIAKLDAKLLQVDVKSTNSLVKVWAVKNSKDVVTVVAIHKDLMAKQSARVEIKSVHKLTGDAQLSVLKASTGAYAEHGISYAGLTFDGSKDGRPVGTRKTTPISPSADNTYLFELEPLTIAVLVLNEE